jgi:hypothetical protein
MNAIQVAAPVAEHEHNPFLCPAHADGCGCPRLAGSLCNPYYAAGHCPGSIDVMP